MKKLTVFLLLLSPLLVAAQQTISDFRHDESKLYAQTKQVNQFFRRFNNEEDVKGNRLYRQDSAFRNTKGRKKYINGLFDLSNLALPAEMKKVFVAEVTDTKAPVFLDFHGRDWYAEVSATFLYKGQKTNLVLFLELEKENLGYKWSISNVIFDRFANIMKEPVDTTGTKAFLHPLSHEVDFMTLDKAFRNTEMLQHYFAKGYEPDNLTLFAYEVKNGNLKFESADNVKFHFFQVKGWYFEVSYFNRDGYNTGWLISNLLRITPEEKEPLMKPYQYGKN